MLTGILYERAKVFPFRCKFIKNVAVGSGVNTIFFIRAFKIKN